MKNAERFAELLCSQQIYACVWLGVYFTVYAYQILFMKYRIVPNFSDARKHCCNLPKIQTKRPNLRVFPQKDANGIANSEDPGAV